MKVYTTARFSSTTGVSNLSLSISAIEEDIQQAIRIGHRAICCVAPVQQDTTWATHFIELVHLLRDKYAARLEVYAGLEVAFEDASGTLAVPALHLRPDFWLVNPKLLPFGNTVYRPFDLAKQIEQGDLSREMVFRHLFRALIGALWKYENVVFINPFSALPYLKLHETEVPLELLAAWARAMYEQNGAFIMDDVWYDAPSSATSLLQFFGLNLSGKGKTMAVRRVAIRNYGFQAKLRSGAAWSVAA